MESKISLY